ncbi:MAG: AAA family ATPase [bacterium]
MPTKIILGVVGQISSGKGAVSEYLQTKYNANVYGFSTSLRDILERLHLPIVRENLAGLSTIIRKQFGNDLMSRVLAEDIKQDTNKLIVVEGVRRKDDLEHIKILPNFKLIRVIADEKTRYERLTKRSQNNDDQTKTFEEFLNDEKAEADQEIPKIMEEAELELDNNGTLEELHQQIDKIIHLNLRLWSDMENL